MAIINFDMDTDQIFSYLKVMDPESAKIGLDISVTTLLHHAVILPRAGLRIVTKQILNIIKTLTCIFARIFLKNH